MDSSLPSCFQIQVSVREMASSTRQDWSDDDEDDVTQIETSVLLGVPDGPAESASDLKDVAVSRIGGLPVRPISVQACTSILLSIYDTHSQALLSPQVSFDSSCCQHCKNPMELLVQLWAPFEDSPYDRAVYVWSCARSGCQRKGGRYVPYTG
jgi:pre-rRNA-processing protein TSR4